MRSKIEKIVHWLPRVLAVIGILFLSIVALEVFLEYDTLSDIALALTMHLVPSFILLVATVIALRWRMVGGVLFMVLGIVSIVFFNTYEDLIVFLLLTVPPLIVGFLFLWEGMMYWVYEDDMVDAVQ